MQICKLCGRDPEEVEIVGMDEENGFPIKLSGHDCHCFYEDHIRVAVGICCGHMLGESLMKEEDFHDGAPWSLDEDCTCDY